MKHVFDLSVWKSEKKRIWIAIQNRIPCRNDYCRRVKITDRARLVYNAQGRTVVDFCTRNRRGSVNRFGFPRECCAPPRTLYPLYVPRIEATAIYNTLAFLNIHEFAAMPTYVRVRIGWDVRVRGRGEALAPGLYKFLRPVQLYTFCIRFLN